MTQPTALWLADWLDVRACGGDQWNAKMNAAAAELRRLHALNQELLEALKEMLGNPAGDYDTTDNYDNACKKAEAVIAKAEGT
jgi:hypothetical protein